MYNILLSCNNEIKAKQQMKTHNQQIPACLNHDSLNICGDNRSVGQHVNSAIQKTAIGIPTGPTRFANIRKYNHNQSHEEGRRANDRNIMNIKMCVRHWTMSNTNNIGTMPESCLRRFQPPFKLNTAGFMSGFVRMSFGIKKLFTVGLLRTQRT